MNEIVNIILNTPLPNQCYVSILNIFLVLENKVIKEPKCDLSFSQKPASQKKLSRLVEWSNFNYYSFYNLILKNTTLLIF